MSGLDPRGAEVGLFGARLYTGVMEAEVQVFGYGFS